MKTFIFSFNNKYITHKALPWRAIKIHALLKVEHTKENFVFQSKLKGNSFWPETSWSILNDERCSRFIIRLKNTSDDLHVSGQTRLKALYWLRKKERVFLSHSCFQILNWFLISMDNIFVSQRIVLERNTMSFHC